MKLKQTPIKTGVCVFDLKIDDIDKDLLKYKWHLGGGGYVGRHINGTGKKELMHRVIAKRMFYSIKGKIIDHINQITIDNRRCNLRLADKTINSLNSKLEQRGKSGYWCVYQQKVSKKWCCYVGGSGRRKHLGSFDTKEIAARIYDKAAKEIYGELARLNFPNE